MGSDAKERLLSMNPWVDLDWPERCKQAAARITELEAALSASNASAEAAEAEAARLREALERAKKAAQSGLDYDGDRLSDDEALTGACERVVQITSAALGGEHG